MGPIGCPETSATKLKSKLSNIPEERRSVLHMLLFSCLKRELGCSFEMSAKQRLPRGGRFSTIKQSQLHKWIFVRIWSQSRAVLFPFYRIFIPFMVWRPLQTQYLCWLLNTRTLLYLLWKRKLKLVCSRQGNCFCLMDRLWLSEASGDQQCVTWK